MMYDDVCAVSVLSRIKNSANPGWTVPGRVLRAGNLAKLGNR